MYMYIHGKHEETVLKQFPCCIKISLYSLDVSLVLHTMIYMYMYVHLHTLTVLSWHFPTIYTTVVERSV